MQGVGEITAAKLLDLENRRQLVWADPVTREWVLETVALRVRRATAAKAAARDRRSRGRRVGQLRPHDREQARAGGVARSESDSAPSSSSLRRRSPLTEPAGVGAAPTRFEAPVAAAEGPRRVVWSEQAAAAVPPPASAAAPGGGPLTTSPPGTAMATRRVDRRRSLKAAERHRSLLSARLAGAPAAVVLLVIAVLAVVALLIAAHGGL